MTVEIAEKIGDFVKERGHPLELLSKLKQEQCPLLQNKGSFDALGELEILFNALEKSKCVDKVVFDLSLARGLDYYTGVIYEAVFKGGTQVGFYIFIIKSVSTFLSFDLLYAHAVVCC